MREIEFRGRDKNYDGAYGPWFYGWYIDYDIFHEIHDKQGGEHSVAPETVGQFTGLTDDSGSKIYEGDVVSVVPILGIHHKGVVMFNKHTLAFEVHREELDDWIVLHDDFSVEILGNIFDNPEFETYKKIYFQKN